MNLNPIRANMTELDLGDGTIILFSYKTPVAAQIDRVYYKTEYKWSATTTRHINQWLNGAKSNISPQSFFDGLIVGVR